MDFFLFTDLFRKVDAITSTFVTGISARSIAALTPVISIGLTISFITYGWLIIRGVIDMPIMEFPDKSVKICIITSIALTGGLYQARIADTIRTLPDELINALVVDHTKKSSAATSIDQTADKGFGIASKAFDHAGFFVENGITFGIIGLVMLISTSIFVALGGTMLLLTKLSLSILAGLGPFFIIALLWQPTVRFFDMWAAQILNYILIAVLATIIFGLMLDIYDLYMSGIKFDGVQNVGRTLGGAVVLSIAMVIILLQVPNIASGLAGGISLSYLHELRSVRSGAASTYSTARGIINNRLTRSIATSTGQGSSAPPQNAQSKTFKGYYKGSSAKQTPNPQPHIANVERKK